MASIPNADAIRERAAILYKERMQEVISEITIDINKAIERFAMYVEYVYDVEYLHPDMCRKIVKDYRAAGYQAYFYVHRTCVNLFITWTDVPITDRRYLY